MDMYFAAFRNAVRFEIGGVAVAYVTEGDVRIIRYRSYQNEDERYNLKKDKVVEQTSRWPRRQARGKYELYYAILRPIKTVA